MTYTCDLCGGVFTSGWSDAEALAEYESMRQQYDQGAAARGLDYDPSDVAALCDLCFKRVTAHHRLLPPKVPDHDGDQR